MPEGVTAEAVCTDNSGGQACWMELDSLPDCYVWNPAPQHLDFDSWSGRCSDGLGSGTVEYIYKPNDGEGTAELSYVNGVLHGTEVLRTVAGEVRITPWVNGERHGTQIMRYSDGSVLEIRFVDGERRGEEWRWADDTVDESP